MGPMIQQTVSQCPQCRGKGKQVTDANRCAQCAGNGHTLERKQRMIRMKSGLETGHSIHLSGKGHKLQHGRTDVQIQITVEKHHIFRRHKDDLYLAVELALYQAMCGFDKTITHLDGRKLYIRHQGQTEIHSVRKLPGEGMKGLDVDRKGDLYIIFTVRIPSISHMDKKIQEEWRSSLQSFDSKTVSEEKQVRKDFSAFPTAMIDPPKPFVHLQRFHQLGVEVEEKQERPEFGQPPQPGCVHQ